MKHKYEIIELNGKKFKVYISRINKNDGTVSIWISSKFDLHIKIKKGIQIIDLKGFVEKVFGDVIKKEIEKRKQSTRYNLEMNKLTLFGKIHDLNVILRDSKKDHYEIGYKKIDLYLSNENNKDKLVKRLVKKEAERYLINRGIELANKYSFNVKDWKIVWTDRMDGQCNYVNKTIKLNAKLITYSKDYIDYVIIHELCHLIHSNHYKEFWNEVKKFCPNYQKIIENKEIVG